MAQALCDRCGEAIAVGSWPFCPHGEARSSIVTDDVPGGFTVENGFDTPQTFYSKKAHRDALDARGLQIAAKWAGPLDKHCMRMDAPSEKSLRDAEILLSRGPQQRAEAVRDRKARLARAYPITVTEIAG